MTFIAIHYGTTLKESVEDRDEAIRTALKELIRRFDVKEKTETQDESKRACHEHYLDGWKSDGTYTITLSPSGDGQNGIPTGKPFYCILRAYVPVRDADLRVAVQTE